MNDGMTPPFALHKCYALKLKMMYSIKTLKPCHFERSEKSQRGSGGGSPREQKIGIFTPGNDNFQSSWVPVIFIFLPVSSRDSGFLSTPRVLVFLTAGFLKAETGV